MCYDDVSNQVTRDVGLLPPVFYFPIFPIFLDRTARRPNAPMAKRRRETEKGNEVFTTKTINL